MENFKCTYAFLIQPLELKYVNLNRLAAYITCHEATQIDDTVLVIKACTMQSQDLPTQPPTLTIIIQDGNSSNISTWYK